MVRTLAALLLLACASPSSPDDAAVVGDATVTSDAAVTSDADLDAGERADAGPAGLGPPYPIVLAHGFFGFEDFAGLDFVTYFYAVRDYLVSRGEPFVFTPAVDPFNDSATRGEELSEHIEAILLSTGHRRVNLIGHSQGGLDARYVASVRPDLVASVTTYATPHRGTPIADIVLELVEDPRLMDLADRLVRLVGAALWDTAGEQTSVFRALEQLSTPGIEAFNSSYPDRASVAYYSLTGRTDFSDGGADCDVVDSPPFIARYASERDPVDLLLDLPEQITDGGLENAPNDGLVRVRDARWGRFLGCVPADHFDEIGQLFGDRPGLGNDFDYLALFVDLIAFLRAEGH